MIATVSLIALLIAGALFAIGVAFADRGDDVGRRLLELERTATTETVRGSKIVKSMVDEKERAVLSNKFAEAGWYKTTVISFTIGRLMLAAAGGALGFLITVLLHFTLLTGAVAVMLCAIVGYILLSFVLDAAIRKRKVEISCRMPDLLDMVSTTVEAGTALNGAIAIAVSSMDGALADEFRMTLSDIRVGMARSDALTAMARRVKQVDLSSVVTALVQTEKLGGNVASVLDELAEEARSRRLHRAEELAAKIPVKMIIPMAFFMLPALLVMVFGPVLAQFMNR